MSFLFPSNCHQVVKYMTSVKFFLNIRIISYKVLTIRNVSYIFVSFLNKSIIMSKLRPTESELEILQILWRKGASTVRDINDLLNLRRDVGYTTTLKFMQIMNEKGLVIRDTAAKVHIYKAAVKENETKNHLMEDFINVTFQGSAMNLVMQALGNSKSSPEELKELKTLIDQIENNS